MTTRSVQTRDELASLLEAHASNMKLLMSSGFLVEKPKADDRAMLHGAAVVLDIKPETSVIFDLGGAATITLRRRITKRWWPFTRVLDCEIPHELTARDLGLKASVVVRAAPDGRARTL